MIRILTPSQINVDRTLDQIIADARLLGALATEPIDASEAINALKRLQFVDLYRIDWSNRTRVSNGRRPSLQERRSKKKRNRQSWLAYCEATEIDLEQFVAFGFFPCLMK